MIWWMDPSPHDLDRKLVKRFAFWPVKRSDGLCVWLETYYLGMEFWEQGMRWPRWVTVSMFTKERIKEGKAWAKKDPKTSQLRKILKELRKGSL